MEVDGVVRRAWHGELILLSEANFSALLKRLLRLMLVAEASMELGGSAQTNLSTNSNQSAFISQWQ